MHIVPYPHMPYQEGDGSMRIRLLHIPSEELQNQKWYRYECLQSAEKHNILLLR